MLNKTKRLVRSCFPWAVDSWRSLRASYSLMTFYPVRLPLGFNFAGNRFMMNGDFEPEETAALIKLLDNTDVFVDVGANIGFYSCLAKSKKTDVVAVEPLPKNLQFLYRNLRVNGWKDVEVFPVALDAAPGISTLFGVGTAASMIRSWSGVVNTSKCQVPVSTIDILLSNRFRDKRLLIKVDVEGVEYGVLKGACLTLSRSLRPVWMVEVCLTEHHPNGMNPHFSDIFDAFWSYGYKAYTANNQFRSVHKRDVQRWVLNRIVDFGTHNFIFM